MITCPECGHTPDMEFLKAIFELPIDKTQGIELTHVTILCCGCRKRYTILKEDIYESRP